MKDYTVKIIVAAHQKYKMPHDSMYLPLHVGAEGKTDENGQPLDFGFAKDNSGDNISELNPRFCELTGLYWAWKNLNADYIGLVHYRRYFSLKRKAKDPFENILSYDQLKPYLGKIKVFTPGKRRYYIETLYSHYAHTHYVSQLDETKKIIEEKYPEYLSSFDNVLNHTYGYMFNMMIMDRELLNNYCSWLFDILFELQNHVDESHLTSFECRFYGRISEIIFNVWLDHQIVTGNLQKSEMMEIPCVHMEKINWWKKGTAFLKAKFFGKRYESSF